MGWPVQQQGQVLQQSHAAWPTTQSRPRALSGGQELCQCGNPLVNGERLCRVCDVRTFGVASAWLARQDPHEGVLNPHFNNMDDNQLAMIGMKGSDASRKGICIKERTTAKVRAGRDLFLGAMGRPESRHGDCSPSHYGTLKDDASWGYLHKRN